MRDNGNLSRRRLISRALLLAGAMTVTSCDFLPGSKKPASLSPRQSKLLDVLADTVMPPTDTPGAVAAGVTKKIRELFSEWASKETRERLSGALDRLDAAAQAQLGANFIGIPELDRQPFLAKYDEAALKEVALPDTGRRPSLFEPATSFVDPGYKQLKELIVGLYYSSEVGLTKEIEYAHTPGPWQPSLAINGASRPALTFGPY